MKAPDAFRTISEVAEELDLPQHVLRFWETRFAQIKPMKRGGGRRYYRPEDVDLLRGIRVLLYAEGFTIRGVQRLLKEKGIGFVAGVGQSGSTQAAIATDAGARGPHPGAAEAAPEPAADDLSDAAAEDEADLDEADLDDADAAPDLPPRAEAPPAPAAHPTAIAGGLSAAGRRKVEAALADLLEAKRLLDQVLG